MPAKEYLKQYRKAEQRLFDLDQQLYILRAKMEKMGGVYSDTPARTSCVDKLPTLMCEYILREQSQESERRRCAAIMSEVRCTIRRIDNPRLRTLLEYRYLDGYDWEQVANLMRYGEYHVRRDIHGAALREISTLIHADTPCNHDENVV
jgi:hypothetical protein